MASFLFDIELIIYFQRVSLQCYSSNNTTDITTAR